MRLVRWFFLRDPYTEPINNLARIIQLAVRLVRCFFLTEQYTIRTVVKSFHLPKLLGMSIPYLYIIFCFVF